MRVRARQKLYAKTFVAFVLWAASWGTLIFAPLVSCFGVPALAGLIFATVLIGFCVQHNAIAAHPSKVPARELPDGLDVGHVRSNKSYAWRVKHNIAHHTYTNVAGYDDDINQAPFARLTPNQTPKPFTGYITSTSGRCTA